MGFLEKANEIIERRLEVALSSYDYPRNGLSRGDAAALMSRLRKALDDFRTASDNPTRIVALNEIINVVGTQGQPRSLYGGPGGSTDDTNPNNPLGQVVSSAADAVRYQARKELRILKAQPR